MSNSQDLYVRLGVEKSASEDEIRRAYRTLARKWHPDVRPGDKQAEQRFKEISAAYEVLSDPKKRKLYDEFGAEGLQSGFNPEQARAYKQWGQQGGAAGGFDAQNFQHFDFADLSDLFSGRVGQTGFDQTGFGRSGFGQSRQSRRKGRDVHATVELSFMDALRGVEVQAHVPGSNESVTVRIPAGADDGSRLTVKGSGEPNPAGGPPGDLIIETRVRPHPHFRREGLDLYLTLPVTLDEAYTGASIDVPTPDGNVKLKVPPRSQNGARLRLREKGVPKKNQRGDLYVELSVVLPDRADEALSQALREANDLYSEPVRKDLRAV